MVLSFPNIPHLCPLSLGNKGGWMHPTPPAGVETEPWKGKDLVSCSTMCSACRSCWKCTRCSGSFFFSYEEMDVMLIKCVLVTQGPGFIMYNKKPDDQILLVWLERWRSQVTYPFPTLPPLLGSPMESLHSCDIAAAQLSFLWLGSQQRDSVC